MEVFALFDDQSCEKISLQFLKPSSQGQRIELTYLSNVQDNIRESSDKGIKEAYVMASSYSNIIPDRISLLFRGFEKSAHGSSTDLAFAVSFAAHMVNKGYILSNFSSRDFFVTGVIGKDGEVFAVKGIKEKLIAAVQNTGEAGSIFIYPNSNRLEMESILAEDTELASNVKDRNICLIPVKTLGELFGMVCANKEVNRTKYTLVSLVVVITLLIAGIIIFNVQHYKNEDLSSINTWLSKTPEISKTPEVPKTPEVLKTHELLQTPETLKTLVPSQTSTILPTTENTTIKAKDEAVSMQLKTPPSIAKNSPAIKENQKLNTGTGQEKAEAGQKSPMYVVDMVPENNAIGVPLNPELVVKYSKPLANITSGSIDIMTGDSESEYKTLGYNALYSSNEIKIRLKNLEPSTKYTVKMPEYKDKAGNSCPAFSFSFTTDCKEINKIFNDGNISFKYPWQFDLKEVVKGKEYFAEYRDITLKLEYYDYEWPSIEEHRKALEDFDRVNQPGIYSYSTFSSNVLSQTRLNYDNEYTYETMYTNGMGKKIAQITIGAKVPLGKLSYEQFGFIIDTIPLIGTSLKIISKTPCDATAYIPSTSNN